MCYLMPLVAIVSQVASVSGRHSYLLTDQRQVLHSSITDYMVSNKTDDHLHYKTHSIVVIENGYAC
jgi:hypothetical protein